MKGRERGYEKNQKHRAKSEHNTHKKGNQSKAKQRIKKNSRV